MQEDIKEGKIKEIDLKKEEIIKLKKLYQEQIEQITKSIHKYSNQIIELKIK